MPTETMDSLGRTENQELSVQRDPMDLLELRDLLDLLVVGDHQVFKGKMEHQDPQELLVTKVPEDQLDKLVHQEKMVAVDYVGSPETSVHKVPKVFPVPSVTPVSREVEVTQVFLV